MSITPKFGRKRVFRGPQMGQKLVFLPILSKGRFSPSELQEVEVRICVRPNSPIINLILLTAFHKFARSRGQNTSAITNSQAALLIGSMNDCHRDIITRLVGLVS